MLGFQAKSSPLLVHQPTLSLESAIEEVSGIELNTGLISQHTQDSSAARLVDFCGIGQFVSSAIDYCLASSVLPHQRQSNFPMGVGGFSSVVQAGSERSAVLPVGQHD